MGDWFRDLTDRQRWLTLAAIVILALGGWQFFFAAPCPSGIRAQVDSDAYYVAVGGTDPFLTGTLVAATAECLPSRRGENSFEIAATATVQFIVLKQEAVQNAVGRGLDMDVKFDAISNTGVVLGSGQGTFRAGSETGRVSGKVYGLSRDAMRRVSLVKVGWVYGS